MRLIQALFLIVSFSFILPLALGLDSYFVLEVNTESPIPEVLSFNVISNNLFYQDYFFQGVPSQTPYWVTFYNQDNVSMTYDVVDYYTLFPYNPNVSRIVFGTGTTELKNFSFSGCNFNNLCEPCVGGLCDINENYLTCPSDCRSASADLYCDLEKDSFCDPDCFNMDADCDNCSPCYYSYTLAVRSSCSQDFDGNICSSDELCVGNYTYADDSGTFCCVGNCMVYADLTPEEKAFVESKSKISMPLILVFIIIIILILSLILFYLFQNNMQTNVELENMKEEVKTLRFRGFPDDYIMKILLDQKKDPKLIKKSLE